MLLLSSAQDRGLEMRETKNEMQAERGGRGGMHCRLNVNTVHLGCNVPIEQMFSFALFTNTFCVTFTFCKMKFGQCPQVNCTEK